TTPLLRSPKRKLRETAFFCPETHSLGSRLGLLGIRFCSPLINTRKPDDQPRERRSPSSTGRMFFWCGVAAASTTPLLRSPKRKLRETAFFAPKPIPSARASGFNEFGSAHRTIKPWRR
ncbi:MAG: hypothetical protein ACO37F_13485, partial [Pirellulales bacterium]